MATNIFTVDISGWPEIEKVIEDLRSLVKDYEKENDDLLRENDRLLKALAKQNSSRVDKSDTTDTCACGRNRIGCEYHDPTL